MIKFLSALVALCLIGLVPTFALSFPDNYLTSHPFFTDPQFSSIPKSPAILRRYFRRNGGTLSAKGVSFRPQHASYVDFTSGAAFASHLDALHVAPGKIQDILAPDYLTVQLNGPARLILLLSGPNFGPDILPKLKEVQGLPERWGTLKALRTAPGANHTIAKGKRVKMPLKFPLVAAAMQRNFGAGESIVLPHPRSLKVNGRMVDTYALLFAKPGRLSEPPQAFEYQAMPVQVKNRQTGDMVTTEPVVPNETCPDWVHDLYVVKSRDGDVATAEGEMPYWRTWHPPIDPVFWCYFTNEHGTYPGKYRPMFGYTAWKTPDESTLDGRQDESHEGFKVFSFPLHDQEKFVVMTVHMRLADARRFHTRFHTVVFAVLDKNWELELEFHMKADFGFAFASSKSKDGNRKQIPLTERDRAIQMGLRKKGFLAGRRINVLNINDNYPDSVDTRFAFRNGLQPNEKNLGQIILGVYEKWITPLNTCTKSKKGRKGFIIDVQNPSTAKKTFEGNSSEPMQKLAGSAEHRVIDMRESFGTLEVGPKHCDFFSDEGLAALQKTDGVFFTNPYFTKVHTAAGKNSLRQYIKPGFDILKIKPGTLTPLHGWSGHMDYESVKDPSRKLMNPEFAFFAGEN